jgi:hypothetical protein
MGYIVINESYNLISYKSEIEQDRFVVLMSDIDLEK